MDTPGLVKITDVVNSYINETGESTDNFFRYLQIVIEGLTSLNIKNTIGFKVYFTSVNSNNIIHFPSDMIKYSRIGILKDGLIYTLTKTNNLALPNGDICGVEVVADDNLNTLFLPSQLNYAQGGGYNLAAYRIDDLGRRIIFKGSLTGETVVIEYKSSGVNLSGETYIPVIIIPVLKEYLNLTITKRNKNASLGEKQQANLYFINARNDYVKTKHAFNMTEFLDAIYSGYSQGVKR